MSFCSTKKFLVFLVLLVFKTSLFFGLLYQKTFVGNGLNENQSASTCVFPFIYREVTYRACTTVNHFGIPWCSTKTDAQHNYIKGDWMICKGHLNPPPKKETIDRHRKQSKHQKIDNCLNSNLLQVDYRRRLADKINRIQLDIAKRVGSGRGIVDSKWVLHLREVVAELDPRRISSGHPSEINFNKSDDQSQHVCPEVYKFDFSDYPYFQTSLRQVPCTNVPKFHEILTILLLYQTWKPDDLNFIASKITNYYDIQIIVLVKNSTIIDNSKPEKLKYLEVKHEESDSEAISRALKLIKTPLILIGDSITQFNNQSSLERLVRVLDKIPYVKVAAGVARDSQGRWIHGCLQQKMENYHATYDMGYYSSHYECMYCDDLLTPFVTYTNLFEQVPLVKGLNGPVVFHDWFVRVRYAGHLVMACPDVMFYVHTHPMMTRSDWRRFAIKWSLTRIKSYNDKVLDFSCSEAKIGCPVRALVGTHLMPPCCLENIIDEIGFILDFAEKNNIHYELQGGSVLGAVKLGTHLPWDIDMDFYFDCVDWRKWIEIIPKLKERKCRFRIKSRGIYFQIFCPTAFYEFNCWLIKPNISRTLMPQEFINIPTKINFGGKWRSAVSNPGLFSRNSFGMEYLRHVPHWRYLKLKSNNGYNSKAVGAWIKCGTPNHHACLDHFPADGSLQFVNR